MTESILTLALDFSRPDCPAVVQCKQEDTGRILKITLSDAGVPYTITEDCYVVFTAVKPDGTIIHNPCQVEGNTVLYRFTEQTCAAVGRMVCEIKLYGADDKLLTSASFLMEVHKTVFRNGDPVVSEDEVNTLKHLICEANAVLSEVESEAEQIVAKLSSGAVEVFNRNAAERTEELNLHAGQLLDDAEAAFNRNAAEKTAEFDRHAGELQQSVAALQTVQELTAAAVDAMQGDISGLQAAQELTSAAIGAVRDDISELRTAQAETMAAFSGTDRRLNYLWKKNAGILYDTEMVTGSGSVVPVPSGAMAVACLNRIGCMSQRGESLVYAGVDKITSVNGTGAAIEEKPIPQTIRDACPDYGIGVNENCYNYIDLAEKAYHHAVSCIDMGSLNYSSLAGQKEVIFRATTSVPDMVKLSSAATNPNFLTNRYTTSNAMTIYQTDIDMVIGMQYDNGTSTGNKIWIRDLSCADAAALKSALSGVMLCYELAEKEVIDLSSVWGDFDQRIAVEAGGSLHLHYPEKDSGYEVAVPSRMEIMVNLSEVEA